MINEILEKFEHLGYSYQKPNTDKTYFFVKHTEEDSKMIWIKLKRTAEVETKVNHKPADLTNEEELLVAELIGASGIENYKIIYNTIL